MRARGPGRIGRAAGPGASLEAHRIGSDVEWKAWFRAAGVFADGDGAPASPRITADTQSFEVAAARANDAAAIGSPVMFGPDLAAGRLVQPFEVYFGETDYWLVYPQDRRRAGKIAAFREWLLAEVAADPYAQKVLARTDPAAAAS